MGLLNAKQLSRVSLFLDQQGLTFKPLREEMMDHLIGDLEDKINDGASFEQAWMAIVADIPEDHFESIQQDVMETINKKYNISKALSYLSLFLILTMVVFKVLHLSLSGILLLITFGTIGASLFFGTIYGLYPFKDKKESLLLMGAVVGIELFLLSFGFQVLHLPGLTALRLLSVLLLLIFFPAITWYLGVKGNNGDHILTYLHDKHSPGIERYLMVLLLIALVLRFVSLGFGVTPDVSHILLFLVMAGAGMQFFALNWHYQQTPSRWVLLAVTVAFSGFVLPAVSWMTKPLLSENSVVILTALFFIISAGIAYFNTGLKGTNRWILNVFIAMMLLLYLSWLSLHLGVLDKTFNNYIFNLPVLLLLLAFLIYFRKLAMIKMFLMIVIAHYLYEYPIQLGLW